MPRQRDEFLALEARVRLVRNAIARLDPGAPERAEMGKYLCILASGLIEARLRATIAAMVRNRRPPAGVGNAAVAFGETITSPGWERLVTAVKRLDPEAARRLSALDEQHRTAVSSIMSNRHLIAHGRDCQLSPVQVERYIVALEPVLQEIARIQ